MGSHQLIATPISLPVFIHVTPRTLTLTDSMMHCSDHRLNHIFTFASEQRTKLAIGFNTTWVPMWGFSSGSEVKNLPKVQEPPGDAGLIPGSGRSLEGGPTTAYQGKSPLPP